jgi:hypothetical protein
MLPGVFQAAKKDGTIYYRSNITYHSKHISLGSYPTEQEAFEAFCDAHKLLEEEISIEEMIGWFAEEHHQPVRTLSFEKSVSLINFRERKMYMANPIYMRHNYFSYYLSPTEELKFDIDDLFYYSQHKIIKRKGHLFVNDYGMQVTILSRYGVKSHAVLHRDYEFANGDVSDFRYSNIVVKNHYHGVQIFEKNGQLRYRVKIHINGNYTVGIYSTEEKAAIAYNKAVDCAKKAGIIKNFAENYIENLTASEYADIYIKLKLSTRYLTYLNTLAGVDT